MIQDNTNYFNTNTFVGSNANVNTIDKFDYNSFYRAYVVDTNDPENLGRVKIRIPALHENSTTYPWAYPATLTGFGFQTGMFMLPPIGALVWVTFEYSDEHRPIYFGGIPTTYASGKYQSYGQFIYSGNDVEVSRDDVPIEFTGTQQILYKSPKGSIIYFDSNDINNVINIMNIYKQRFKIAAISNLETGKIDRYIEMAFDDNNYFRLKENEVHLIVNGEEVQLGGGGGGSGRAEWGHITGYLADQTDLQNALNLKANDADISRVGKSNNYNDLNNKPTIPTKTSQLTNDSNFATTSQLPTKVSALDNDSGYITSSDIPTEVSYFDNDAGYITQADVPTHISAFDNDMGYLTHEVDPTVPGWAKEAVKPSYTKEEVGLGNVDNKSSEEIRNEITFSNVTNALNYIPVDEETKGKPYGVAELDETGRVPTSQLPSYIDDVIEGYYNSNDGEFYEEPEFINIIEPASGKIYVDIPTNRTYRWSGNMYVIIASDLALGETHSTAYYGDLGAFAYEHAMGPHAPANAEPNVLEAVYVNDEELPISNKAVNITVPTSTNDLLNESGFITNEVDNLTNYYKKTETYNQEEIDNMLGTSGLFTLITEETYAEELDVGYYIMKDNGSIIFRSDITQTASRYEIARTYPGDMVLIQVVDGIATYTIISCYPARIQGFSERHAEYNQEDDGLSLSVTYLSQDSDGNFYFMDSTVLESQISRAVYDIRSDISLAQNRYCNYGLKHTSTLGIARENYSQSFYELDYTTLDKTVTIPAGSLAIGNYNNVVLGEANSILIITPELHAYIVNGNTDRLHLINEFDIAKANDIPTKVSELENDSHFITSEDNTIKNIVQISYEDYKTLENTGSVDPDTEYHITENGSTGSIEYEVKRIIREMDEIKHPIGSLEFNTSGTNPATYLGFGTWELWGAGRVPIGVDSTDSSIDEADKKIGNKTASTTYTPAGTNSGTAITLNAIELTHSGGAVGNHTLTTDEMPSHSHAGLRWANDTNGTPISLNAGTAGLQLTYAGNGQDATKIFTNKTGGGGAHNHSFTQPSKHSFTPTTKSITQPTFTGTQATITESTIQPSISCYMWKRIA